MAIDLKSKTARSNLALRSDPYFVRLEAGLYIGYRVMKQGGGTWSARKRGDDGKQKTIALGTFASFDDAAKAARAWAADADRGVTVFKETVGEACLAYTEEMETRKTAKAASDNDARFKRLVYGKSIENIRLSKLKPQHIRDWLNAQVVDEDEGDEEDIRRSKDSANRNLSALKAALNLAHRDGRISAKPWEAVQAFQKVAKGRTRFITKGESDALIKCMPDDMATFAKAMLLTACRPGELAGIEARHFDREKGTLELAGKTGRRVVTLSTDACLFFADLATDKIGAVLLLHRADGLSWNKDWWKKLFNKARTAAKLPDDIVLYSLRHAAISEMIGGGVDTFLVARLAGTSTAMIDKHYGHLRHDKTRAMLDAARHKANR